MTLYIINNVFYFNGKRGAKPKFTDVYCSNQDCKFYGISGRCNTVGNGTYQINNKRIWKYICHECERQNLTFRQDNNRISRKTIGFSKKLKYLYNQIRVYCIYLNLFRNHRGLIRDKEHGFVENLSKTASRGWNYISKTMSCHSVQINGDQLFRRISTKPKDQ